MYCNFVGDKECSNLAQVQANKGQPAPTVSHLMNNGSRSATAPAPANAPAPAPPTSATAVPVSPAADVQKLQQQLQDIKEQVKPGIYLFIYYACTKTLHTTIST